MQRRSGIDGVWWGWLALGCCPLLWLLLGALHERLGANPAEVLLRSTGDWALRFLCLTLAITPLRHLCGRPRWLRFRRLLGLLCFAYAALHLLGYAWLDMGLVWADIVRDLPKRPFVLVGTLAFALLLALALTSWNGAVARLGAQRWRALHRCVYAVALLVLLHFGWMRSAKNQVQEVWVYTVIVALLLGWRIWHAWRSGRAGRAGRPARGTCSPVALSPCRPVALSPCRPVALSPCRPVAGAR